MYRTHVICAVICKNKSHIDNIDNKPLYFDTYDEAKDWCLDERTHRREDTLLTDIMNYLYNDDFIEGIYIDYGFYNCETNRMAYSNRVWYY